MSEPQQRPQGQPQPRPQRPPQGQPASGQPQPTAVGQRAAGPDPYAEVVAACEAAAARFTDPNGLGAVDAIGHMAGAVTAMAAMFERIAGTVLTEVHVDPKAAPFIDGVARYVRAAVPACEEAAGAFRRAHAADIERIETADIRMRAWDVSAHD